MNEGNYIPLYKKQDFAPQSMDQTDNSTFSPIGKSDCCLLSLLTQITGRSVDNMTVRSCKFYNLYKIGTSEKK